MKDPEWIELSGEQANEQWGTREDGDQWFGMGGWRQVSHINFGRRFSENQRYRRRAAPRVTEEIHF